MKTSKRLFIFSSNGFSILEVVVALGLMGILSLAVVSTMEFASREQSFLQQKMDVLSTQGLITQTLSDPSSCSVSFTGLPYSPATHPSTLTLNKLLTGPTATSDAIVKTDPSVPGGLLVSSIKITGITLYSGTTFTGKLEIDFKNSVRAVKKMSVPAFRFNASTATNLVVGCGDAAATFQSNYCYALRAGRDAAPSCESGYYMKAIIKFRDNTWDGTGAVCCYSKASDMRPMPAAYASPGSKIVPASWGKTYNQLVAYCNSSQGNFKDGHEATCPSPELMLAP